MLHFNKLKYNLCYFISLNSRVIKLYVCDINILISILFDLCEFQYAVLYSGQECLGGSIISHVGPSHFILNRENCIGELNAINK